MKHKLTIKPAKLLSFTGLRKVYPYYFTFTTFTKGRWVGEKILDVFGREFRAHPVEEYVRNESLLLLFEKECIFVSFLLCFSMKLFNGGPILHFEM